MKSFLALFHARNKEFFRDRGAMSWALVFPILIIIGCALAFSEDQEILFKIGVHGLTQDQIQALPLLHEPYVRLIHYDDVDLARQRIAHHQLHMLVSQRGGAHFWVNERSSQGDVLRALMQQQAPAYTQALIDGKPIRYVDWVLPGVLGMNIMFGSLFGVGYVIVRYRKTGVLKRLQATPVNAAQFLAAQAMARLVVVVGASSVIFMGATWALDAPVHGRYLDLLVVAILGALAMIGLALVISARTASEELAGGILNATTWPMMFLSGVWFSLDEVPSYMQALANCLPLTHLVAAARDIMINGATLWDERQHITILMLMLATFVTIASFSFRWHR